MDNNYEEVMKLLLSVLNDGKGAGQNPVGKGNGEIPVGISNRHIHLSQADLDTLFGPGYQLTPMKDLSQPGQFACKEMVTIVGPKGAIEKVRILGPVRKATQIEVLAADGFKLGVKGELRMSGDLAGTSGATVVGPKGSVQLREGLIVAQRHIHMTLADAARLGVKDGDIVDVKISGPRGGVLSNVAIRANDTSALDFHIDTEEANALGLTNNSTVTIVK
jgi:propanediol utilization protein